MFVPFRLILAPLLAASALTRSDLIGVYGSVDRVVLAPDATNPTTIQIWGTFALSEAKPGDHYLPATKGYLYFRIDPAKARVIRAEWADIGSMAGKGIIGFGAKYTSSRAQPRVRCATEAPTNPDVYEINIGMVKQLSDPPNTAAQPLRSDLTSGKAPAAPCPGRGL